MKRFSHIKSICKIILVLYIKILHTCDICENIIVQKRQFQYHLGIVHSHACDVCEKVFEQNIQFSYRFLNIKSICKIILVMYIYILVQFAEKFLIKKDICSIISGTVHLHTIKSDSLFSTKVSFL